MAYIQWQISQGFDERLYLWCLSVPELLGGKQLSATVIDLSPWVEYEFRVLATNSIGTGEPSKPSKKARTKEMRMYQKLLAFFSVATSDTNCLQIMHVLHRVILLQEGN